MKKIILSVAFVAAAVLSSMSASAAVDGIAFQCVFANGKTVSLIDNGDQTMTYSFYSKSGATELEVTNTYKQMEHDWFYSRGEGFVAGVLTVKNGAFSYSVTQSEKEGIVGGSLMVTKGSKTLANLDCVPGSVKGDADSGDGYNDITQSPQ